MSQTLSSKRVILVSGATGRQGKSFIHALTSSSEGDSFHILALTRQSKGQRAQELTTRYSGRVSVVEGDLDSPGSVRRVFETQRDANTNIWGVFCVLAFPGLGVRADGEEKQGKSLADLSLEFGVSHFVFSSVERGGEGSDETMMDDRLAKIRIEKHVQDLGTKGLKWTIIRPGFFMENYEGLLGSITFGVLKAGLKPTTTVQLIAADDIGYIAAAVFKDPSTFESEVLVAAGDISTVSQQEEAHKKATGRPMSSIPSFLARTLISLNKETKGLIADMERVHTARSSETTDGEYWRQLEAAKRAYPGMRSFQEWCQPAPGAKQEKLSTREGGWNGVALGKLLRGKQ
ncbi:hypothetical protein V5O48_010396 [Marasmius crinis-equi]|uniref:NmrA-like domain-containing protein n=1 Tax=Marasmius crinis-equi TaxID=585013 RepID=A0ABR3F8H2_9AGAR